MRRDKSGLSSSPDAELKTYVGVFENFAYGLRNRGVIAGLSRHNQKNRSVFRGRIWELGGKILSPPKFQIRPLNTDYYFWCCPGRPTETAHWRIFQKIQRTFSVLWRGWGIMKWMTLLAEICSAPAPKAINRSELGKNGFFAFLYEALQVLGKRVIYPSGVASQTQNYKLTLHFSTFLQRASTMVLFLAVWTRTESCLFGWII